MKVPFNATHRRQSQYVEKLHEATYENGIRVIVYRRLEDSSIRVTQEAHFHVHFQKIKKFRIREYRPGFIDSEDPITMCWCDDFADIDQLRFVERWSKQSNFVEFRIGLKDGHEVTLMAIMREPDNSLKYWVAAFIASEDYSKEDMLKRWKQWNTDDKGNLIEEENNGGV
jgi:hypothetical protein